MKHTIGPWAVVSRGEGRVHDNIMAGEKRVASIGQSTIGNRDEAAANARLVAAAPDLLAALEGLMWRFEADDEDPHQNGEEAPDIVEARAAIKKATEPAS